MLIKPRDPVTALTLLDCFDAVCPKDVKSGLWEEDDARHCPASLYRLQQLKALFRAFDIAFDPEEFAEGHFVRSRWKECEPLIERLSQRLTDGQRWRTRSSSLGTLFWWLRAYRCELLRAARSYAVFLSCPPIVHAVMEEIVVPVSGSIESILVPIGFILAELIDPRRRVFHLDELIEHYGHPTGDYAEMRFKETDLWSLAEEYLNDPET
jgi:hypothetical protein